MHAPHARNMHILTCKHTHMQALVPKSVLGTLMGMEHSIFAMAGMIGPLLGTYVFQRSGLSGLSSVCSVVFFGVLFVAARYQRPVADEEMSKEKPS